MKIVAIFLWLTKHTTHLEGLHERPEQDADRVALTQQLDEASRAEEPKESQTDEVVLKTRPHRCLERTWRFTVCKTQLSTKNCSYNY